MRTNIILIIMVKAASSQTVKIEEIENFLGIMFMGFL